MPLSSGFWMFLAAFRRSTSGNIAILTALLLAPVMGIAGLAVDYSISSLQHSRLTALADSTVLLGARRGKALIEEGGSTTSRLNELQTQLENHFRREAALTKEVNPKVKLVQNGLALSVKLDWEFEVPSVFGRLFGQEAYLISGGSASEISAKPFVHLIVLLDVSQSMGIGATSGDQVRLFNLEGCMFACHLPPAVSSSRNNKSITTYQAARAQNPPINTRVDVARQGLLGIIDLAEKDAGGSIGRVKVGVYTFSNRLTAVAPIDQPIASDFNALRKRVAGVMLGTEGGGTNMMGALNQLQGLIRDGGDGVSRDRPRVFVLVLSDGVANSTLVHKRSDGSFGFSAEQPFHSRTPSQLDSIQLPRSEDDPVSENASHVTVRGVTQIDAGRIGAMDERACTALKNRGVTMMVVATEYVIPTPPYRAKTAGKPGDDLRFEWFSTGGRLGDITNRMRACASEDYFVSVKDGAAIQSALTEMGALALTSHLRLTR